MYSSDLPIHLTPGARPGPVTRRNVHRHISRGAGLGWTGEQPRGLLPPVRFVPVRRRTIRWARWGSLVAALLIGCAIGWWIGLPALHIWNSLRLMTQLPAPATTSPTPHAAEPRSPQQPRRSAPPSGGQPRSPGSGAPHPVSAARPAPPSTPTPTATPVPPPAPGALTLLVLGTDLRPNEGTLARSDTIMVVRMDPATQRVALLSLPRDLWVSIPGAGHGKINSAYFVGQETGQGAMLAKETVSQVLGIPIDYTAVVDFRGFRTLVDALGGITVDVPKELYDPRFPTDDYGYTVAHFLPGPQVMNGDQALTFSRIRHPDSDFERMRRQQLVVLGIARKLRERGAVRNLAAADQLTTALQPYIRTDLPPTTILGLLWSFRSLDPQTIQRATVDSSRLREGNIGGAYVLLDPGGVLHELGAKLVAAP